MTLTSRLANALLEMAGAVLLLDRDGRVAGANGSARRLFGPVEPKGLTLPELFEACGASDAAAPSPNMDAPSGTDPMLSSPASTSFAAEDRICFPLTRPSCSAGVSGPSDAVAYATGVPSSWLLRLSDSRTIECVAQPLSSGGWIVSVSDITAHRSAVDAAQRDPLTGLANRTAFRDQMLVHLVRLRRSALPLAVLCLDLDRFKAVNDALGHPMGDTLLQRVADRLRSAVRDGDVVARLGGDEFAVIQPEAAPEATEALARRLVDLIGRTYVVEGHMLNVGASVGIAVAPADGEDPDRLLKHADLALYRAKSAGRGGYRFFEPSMDAQMQSRRALEIDLRKALALKEFKLVYQPQVNLDTGVVCGFEALLRWHHPDRGLVSPAEFIPLAEEIGLIGSIGEWVLRTACRDAAAWKVPVCVAVNLSPVQFRISNLVPTVTSALGQSGLDASRLELEITEGALMENTDGVLNVLHQVRALGVRVSMDDFGTGYSSLSYLQKFPFDKIKIDRSFVQGLGSDDDCRAIVRAVASLGASLGMETVAEGVETAEQLERIRLDGCSKAQGYLTGRPMTAEQAEILLDSAAAA